MQHVFFSDKGQVRAAVEHAISKGYRNVDAAWIYGNEGEVGEAIEAKINDGTVKREELFVATKECLHKFHENDGVSKILGGLSKLYQVLFYYFCKPMKALEYIPQAKGRCSCM